MAKNRSIKRIIKKKIHIINNKEQIIRNEKNTDPKKKILVQSKIEPTRSLSTPTIVPSQKEALKTTINKNNGRFEARIGVPLVQYVNETPEIFKKKYEKIENVDYDVVVVMSSYDRYDKAKRILTQLFTQNSKYSIKVILYNDGSTDQKYDTLPNIFPNIEYIKEIKNNGKFDYWKSLTTLFKAASKYNTHAVCQIDDDYVLSDQFIDTLMSEFFHIKKVDNKYVTVYYHKTSLENTNSIDIHRIDGGVLFDIKYLEHINFEVKEPVKLHKNNISSGVWRYLSSTIKSNNCLSYRLAYSLVIHDGNEDSKMHKEHRDRHPINSVNFKK